MLVLHLGKLFHHFYVNAHLPVELYFSWAFAAT